MSKYQLVFSTPIYLILANFFLQAYATADTPKLRNSRSPIFIQEQIVSGEQPDFSGEGRPGNNTSWASRSQTCFSANDQQFVALSPTSNYGATTRPNPTLWFYMPEIAPEISEEGVSQTVYGRFGVYEVDSLYLLYESKFTLPLNRSGLIGVTVLPLLEPGHEYIWYFVIQCDPSDPSNTKFVDGHIHYITSSEQLATELSDEKSPVHLDYINHQVWFDAVDSLVRLRINYPDDNSLVDPWNQLTSFMGTATEYVPPDIFRGAMESSSISIDFYLAD
jgi:hypothetical protein